MIRFAEKKDIAEINQLRDLSFPADTEFFKWYNSEIFTIENTILYEKDGKIASLLDRLPFEADGIGKITYIFAACTNPNFRKQGLMSELLEFSTKIDISKGMKASLLVPQNDELFRFYEKNGYQSIIPLYEKKYTLSNSKDNFYDFVITDNGYNANQIDAIYRKTVDGTNFIVRSESYWQSLFSLFNTLGGYLFVLELDSSAVGYAFVWADENPVIQELCCANNDAKKILCHQIMEYFKINEITAFSPNGNSSSKKYGCVKLYEPIENGLPISMNLMLD